MYILPDCLTTLLPSPFGGLIMEKHEMPLGFGMALAQNSEAMQKFAMLSEDKKQEIIVGTHSVKSKEEMHQYVNNLVSNS